MQKEKYARPIDHALESVRQKLLCFLPEINYNLQIVPQGGYFVGRTIGLCRTLNRLKSLLDKYGESKLWLKEPNRKIFDEINLGTLVYIETMTRHDREDLLKKIVSGQQTNCFTSECTELNRVLCKKAENLTLPSFINFHVNEIIDKLNDIYVAENGVDANIVDLRTIVTKIPDPNDVEKYEPHLFTIQFALFESIESMIQLVSYMGLKDTSFTLSEITQLVFAIDNALRFIDEDSRRFDTNSGAVVDKPTFTNYLDGQLLLLNASRSLEPLQKEIQKLRNAYPDFVQNHPYKPESIGESYTYKLLTDEIDLVCDTCVKLLGLLKESVQRYADLTKSGEFDERI